jgi:hypothetical protein
MFSFAVGSFARLYGSKVFPAHGNPQWRRGASFKEPVERVGEVREVVAFGALAADADGVGMDAEGAEAAGEPGFVNCGCWMLSGCWIPDTGSFPGI